MKIYAFAAVNAFIDKMINDGAEVYTIPGALADSYIVTPSQHYKGAIIKEKYLNEWNSGQTVRHFSKISEKTQKIIDLILDEKEEEAARLLYA